MARPSKIGATYFPLDVDYFEDRNLKLAVAEDGCIAELVYLRICALVYRNNFYIQWTDEDNLLLAASLNIDVNKIRKILSTLVKRSLFNEHLFSESNVITSDGIQRRFLEIKKKNILCSKKPIQVNKFWLLSDEECQGLISYCQNDNKSGINYSKSGINDSKSGINSANKIKENKIKENKNIIDFSNPLKNIINFYEDEVTPTPSVTIIQEFQSFLSDGLTDELIINAIKISTLKNIKDFAYIRGILNNYINNKIFTMADLEKATKERNKSKAPDLDNLDWLEG